MVLDIIALITAALIDSVNPCTFAIFFFLMSSLLTTDNKKQMIVGGLFFTLSIFISYFLIGFGLLKTYDLIGLKNIFYYAIGGLAIIVGGINIRNYYLNKMTGCKYNNTLQKILSKGITPYTMFLSGLFCSLFLLPCTSGPYVVITSLITVMNGNFLLYLTIYNIIFILPLLIIIFLFTKGIANKFESWQLKNQRKIDLVSGLLMISIGLFMIIYNVLVISQTIVCAI